MNGVRELLNSSKTRPPLLKADYDATSDIGIAKTSLAKCDKTGNLQELNYHHSRMSNLLLPSSFSSERHFSSSDLLALSPRVLVLIFLASKDFIKLVPQASGSCVSLDGCTLLLGAYIFPHSSNNSRSVLLIQSKLVALGLTKHLQSSYLCINIFRILLAHF